VFSEGQRLLGLGWRQRENWRRRLIGGCYRYSTLSRGWIMRLGVSGYEAWSVGLRGLESRVMRLGVLDYEAWSVGL
jgi:hypothetical protein